MGSGTLTVVVSSLPPPEDPSEDTLPPPPPSPPPPPPKNFDNKKEVNITMTLTAPNCPASDMIMNEVQEKVNAIDEIKDVHVNLTFEPPWTQENMSDVAKLQLGFM